MVNRKKAITPYYVVTILLLAVMAVLFLFPLYWIVTGSVKIKSDIIIESGEMVKWIPITIPWDNFAGLFKNKTESFGMGMPMVIRWLFSSAFISVVAMALTCIIASLAGYVLAKKRFWGKGLIFGLFVCAMALPKQVVLTPLMKEMSDLGLLKSVWGSMFAVTLPMVRWPFDVFMMKQFSENIPSLLLEVACIDGAGEPTTLINVAFPIIKPGFGASAIFVFINSWNEYPLQLVMLTQDEPRTIALGIASKLSEMSNDPGLIMIGATSVSVSIIIVFLCFQRYFTQGITMGAVKG